MGHELEMNLTDYESALEFRELLDFQNVPIIHGRYEAVQKCCSSTQRFRTGQLRNLPLLKWIFMSGKSTQKPNYKILIVYFTLLVNNNNWQSSVAGFMWLSAPPRPPVCWTCAMCRNASDRGVQIGLRELSFISGRGGGPSACGGGQNFLG